MPIWSPHSQSSPFPSRQTRASCASPGLCGAYDRVGHETKEQPYPPAAAPRAPKPLRQQIDREVPPPRADPSLKFPFLAVGALADRLSPSRLPHAQCKAPSIAGRQGMGHVVILAHDKGGRGRPVFSSCRSSIDRRECYVPLAGECGRPKPEPRGSASFARASIPALMDGGSSSSTSEADFDRHQRALNIRPRRAASAE